MGVSPLTTTSAIEKASKEQSIAQSVGSQTNGAVLSLIQGGNTDGENSHPGFTTFNDDHYQEDTMDMNVAEHGGDDIIPVDAENKLSEVEDAEDEEEAIVTLSTPSTGENRTADQAESADDNETASHDGLDWKFVNGNVFIDGIKVSSASAMIPSSVALRKTKRDNGLISKAVLERRPRLAGNNHKSPTKAD